jgi:hypothetical protein
MPELSALRLVKVPDVAPPYDCQVHDARCPARTVEIATPPAGAAPVAVAPAAATRCAAGAGSPAGAGSAAGPDLVAGAGSAAGADLVAAWPRRLAVVVVEVLAGVRPDRQLAPLATDRVRARIRSLAPLLACDRRPRIQRIVVSRPAEPVVELTVVADFGRRSRALALRVEHVTARPAAPGWSARPARWLCTAIEAG